MKHFENTTRTLNFRLDSLENSFKSVGLLNYNLKTYNEHTPIYKAVIDFLIAITWGDIF